MSDLPVCLADVEAAAAVIAGALARTPAIAAPALSALTGADVVLKLETLHRTGSFKERGALAKLASLDAAARRAGVIAMSAGNHAQAVAFHARRLGIPATIVMPDGTPFTKIERTQSHGATIVLQGAGLAEAREAAEAIAASRGLTLIHPYDDPVVIAAQGTAGLELVDDHPDLDTIIVPIGGGGLAAGIAVAAKGRRPEIEVIGVESALYPSMHQALRGLPATAAGGATLAEGIAVKEPGRLTRQIVAALVSDILLLEEREIEAAVAHLAEGQKLVAEGAGAAPLAALLQQPDRFRGRKVGLVICGANIDTRLLSQILMRALVRGGRLVRLRIEIADAPGILARIARAIGERGGNIVEIYHQRLFQDVPVKLAEIDAVVETRSPRHVGEIVAALREAGFAARLLSNSAVEGA